jgi:predicted DNA-binding protein YlxM (UPF0122 family)
MLATDNNCVERNMYKYKNVKTLTPKAFRSKFGITLKVFEIVLEIFLEEYDKKYSKRGRPGIPLEDRLVLAVSYWRSYNTIQNLATDYGASKSAVHRAIKCVEDTLPNNEKFKLRGVAATHNKNGNIITEMIIDVTNQEIECPTHSPEKSYSGHKCLYTMKFQSIMEAETKEILDIRKDFGSKHDFKIFVETLAGKISKKIRIRGDSGYQGIQEHHQNSIIPIKASKNNPLTDDQKELNKQNSKKRIPIEHGFRRVKIFKICGERYRNKGKRCETRFTIIACLHNLMLFN